MAELQTRLQEQLATFSENHPAVLDTQQSLEALRQDSPQVAALKRELAPLEADLKKRGVSDQAPQEVGRPTPVAMQGEVDPHEDEDAQDVGGERLAFDGNVRVLRAERDRQESQDHNCHEALG